MDVVTPAAPGPDTPRPVPVRFSWLRAHPLAVDALIATGVFFCVLMSSVSGPSQNRPDVGPLLVGLAALCSAVLVLRRRMPRTVLAATTVMSMLGIVCSREGTVPPSQLAISVVVALYTVAASTDRHTTWRIGAATVVLLTGTVMIFGVSPWYAQENLGIFAWTGMAAAAGDAVRSRRAFVAAIEERAIRAERTREEEARRRVAEERLRIARELHDVVAHHIALVNVQAGVASHIMDSRPDQAKQALAHVREASRSALGELRATVGLLRQYGDPEAPTEPAPGLGVLDQLIDGFVRSGLRVTVEAASRREPGPLVTDAAEVAKVSGDLPTAVDLTAYRVIQEALTNVHKHAGPAAAAEVHIIRQHDELEITVIDDGGTSGVANAGTGGADGVGSSGGTSGGKGSKGGKGAPGSGKAGPAAGRAGQTSGRGGGAARNGTAEAPSVQPGAADGGGHGLIGMRERVAALRGACEAAPHPEGGFRVRATLPVRSRTGGDESV
ncbi:sensor histidine kinase [Streptomyces zagrosensis]|uniref:sensor histidine kinase n=1 Tax=Streptomyces zagrosensis TaxID=1042984 RepID=UPI0035E3FAE3